MVRSIRWCSQWKWLWNEAWTLANFCRQLIRLNRSIARSRRRNAANFAYDGLNMFADYSGSTLTDRYVFGQNMDEHTDEECRGDL